MATSNQPWWKEPTRAQWLAFSAAWFGWVLDAFDFTVFLLAMPHIAKEMGVETFATTGSLALTYLARLAGGVLAGWAADRWGRKLPLMLSIISFAVFDGAIALAPTFGWVLVLRTLFGFGMGAEWASGTALAMESWPTRSRGIASGVLQGSWAIGYMLAAVAAGYVIPHYGWRGLFVLAALPALMVLPIRAWVPESDAWTKAHEKLKAATASVSKIKAPRAALGPILWGSAAMIVGFSAYNGLTGLYPTMLVTELGMTDKGVAHLVMLFTTGMLIGSIGSGFIASRHGAAVAIATPALLALPFLAFYVGASPALLGVGAFATGLFGAGVCGVTPMLLTDLFPPETRARSIGLVYHVGSSVAAFIPMIIAAVARLGHTSIAFAIAMVSGVALLGVATLLLSTRGFMRATLRLAQAATATTLAVALFFALGGTAHAGGALVEVTNFGANPAGLKMFRHSPANAKANAPLVVALHGCTQTAADYANVGWNELADKYAFHVVYAEQSTTNNAMRCFTWYGAGLARDKGENASIKQMVDKMKADASIDGKRVFVTGLSAGGAETALMLAMWPDVFAAGAPIAGLPYDCATSPLDTYTCMNPGKTLTAKDWADRVRSAYPGYAGTWPRVSVWQGTSDAIVAPANEKEIAKQWAGVHGAADAPSATSTVSGAARSEWRDAKGAVAVEMYAVPGMGHGVPLDPANGCGTAGAYALDVKLCSTQKIAEFFGLTGSASGSGSGSESGSGSSSGSSSGSGSGSGSSSGCAVGAGNLEAIWGALGVVLVLGRRARARKGGAR